MTVQIKSCAPIPYTSKKREQIGCMPKCPLFSYSSNILIYLYTIVLLSPYSLASSYTFNCFVFAYQYKAFGERARGTFFQKKAPLAYTSLILFPTAVLDALGEKVFNLSVYGTEIVLRPGCNLCVQLC